MIVRENYSEGLIRTYSNSGMNIRKIGTNEVYSEAVDSYSSLFSYEETDIPIESGDDYGIQ